MKFPQKPNFKELFMSTGKIIGLLAIVGGVMLAIFGLDDAYYSNGNVWAKYASAYFPFIFGGVLFVTGIFIFVNAKK